MWRTILVENRFSFFYLLMLVVLPLSFSSVLTFFLVKYEALVQDWQAWEWGLFYVSTIFTMAFALTPTTFIALISGFFLGAQSVLLVIPAYLLASLAGFKAAGMVDKGKLLRSVSRTEKVSIFLEGLKRREFYLIILSRLSPVLPFALMNFVLSAMGVKLKNFIVAGFLGMLPRTLLFIWVGMQARMIVELVEGQQQGVTVRAITIALVVISVIGLIWVVSRALNYPDGKK